jgi:type I restriction enzyme S subunit
MSETLEAMARALFKSWFVDFDPVRAKAEGRDPGLPQPLADLFPDSFEDSELGEIPRGWQVGVLGDVLVHRVDRCSPSDETRSRPYVPIECIAARSLLLAESRPGEEAQSSLTRFREGDLLFGAMRPYFHKVAIAPFDGTTRTTVFVLRARQADDFSFATLLVHDEKTIEYATNHSTGSTIPYSVWQGSLEAMPIVLPPMVLRKSFDETVRPLLDRIPPVFFANRTLAALRDALLPKLISGELRVKDAERFLKERGL